MDVDKIIKKLSTKIETLEADLTVAETGRVSRVADNIAEVTGLPQVQAMEMLTLPNGLTGLALNLEADTIGVIILGDGSSLKEGDVVLRTGRVLSIPVGEEYLGRMINPLGEVLDGGSEIKNTKTYLVDKVAPGVMTREPVNVPLSTGIKAIDSMIPIGRGQRELIIGDRGTGKTAIAIDTILNQKGEDVICVYVAIGQKKSNIARLKDQLDKAGAMAYTTIVVAGASDGAALSYLAPYAGTALAEYFMDQQRDVLIIYDDLSKHANAYREISLLLRRPPGREAYPGDIFYLHSRLLERACRRNNESGGGSITALPIIETQAGDVSAYIPTNVISITDGQIFLESNLFYKGLRPAVNVGLSVSRVGGNAQIKAMKKVAGRLKLDMAQYRELESFAQFSSDLDSETKRQLDRGIKITEILKQKQFSPLKTNQQVAIIFAINAGLLDDVPLIDVARFELELFAYLEAGHQELLDTIKVDWTPEVEAKLKQTLTDFKKQFNFSV